METETKTEGVAWDFVRIRQNDLVPEQRAVEVFRGGHVRERIDVTPDELQAIVQAAYDQHGILATPDLDRELARAVEANPGKCRCGHPNCSDRDTVLREFADRWGQSLRGRA